MSEMIFRSLLGDFLGILAMVVVGVIAVVLVGKYLFW